MSNYFLVTATGQDKPGVVSKVTEVFLKHNYNLEESRMAVLGGEFAAIMLVSGSEDSIDKMKTSLGKLESDGIAASVKETKPYNADKFKDYTQCELSLTGADHEGIVHNLSSKLKEENINIQSAHTEVVSAPITGSVLFCMNSTIMVPPSLPVEQLRNDLDKIAQEQSVDIELIEIRQSASQVV